MKIIDNFLSDGDFVKLQSTMLSDAFPWYYGNYKVMDKEEYGFDEKYNFQFVHMFYMRHTIVSSGMDLLSPIIQKINPSAIVRIKANLTPITNEKIVYDMHRDYEFEGKTAIFYINTNNGNTIFEDGTEIESIENRLIIFDSKKYHTGTSCTDEKVRCVINFNYYTWD